MHDKYRVVEVKTVNREICISRCFLPLLPQFGRNSPDTKRNKSKIRKKKFFFLLSNFFFTQFLEYSLLTSIYALWGEIREYRSSLGAFRAIRQDLEIEVRSKCI